jgi:DNA topoisomerase-3
MLQLIAHFGDANDRGGPCGGCDVCAPSSCVAQVFRGATAAEENAAARILAALRERDGRSVGQLHREVFAEGEVERRALEHLLGALVRASEVRLVGDEFVKDDQVIAFQRVHLSPGARATGDSRAGLQMVAIPEAKRPSRKGRSPRGVPVKRGRGKPDRAAKAPSRTPTNVTRDGARESNGHGSPVEGALRSWRTEEARERGIPAFRILTDRTLVGIARAHPSDEDELLAVSGIGPALLKKYGRVLLTLLGKTRG